MSGLFKRVLTASISSLLLCSAFGITLMYYCVGEDGAPFISENLSKFNYVGFVLVF